MPTVTVNERTLFFAQAGKGFPGPELLLVHGAGGSHLDWPAGLRRLPHTAVTTIDLPGHGRSAGPGCNTIAGYANSVADFIRKKGLRQAVIAGHSMGGAIAIELARRGATAVAGLVLLATGARLPVSDKLLQQARHDFAAATEFITRYAWSPSVPVPMRDLGLERLQKTKPDVLYGDLVACNQFDARQELHEISVPALVVGAALDKMTPPKFSQYLADQIPAAQLLLLPETGHMLTLEREAAVVKAVADFLRYVADA